MLHPLFQRKSLFNHKGILHQSVTIVLHPLFQRKSLFNTQFIQSITLKKKLHPLFQRKSLFNTSIAILGGAVLTSCILCFSASRFSTAHIFAELGKNKPY